MMWKIGFYFSVNVSALAMGIELTGVTILADPEPALMSSHFHEYSSI